MTYGKCKFTVESVIERILKVG